MIERSASSGTQTRFPLYDAHGNSIGTLARSGSSWSVGDERAYDAWGRIRQGGQTGAPSARYCASLGHVQDDESGLVYMKARYYEPGTGRFISEDSEQDGRNWFAYAENDPTNKVDPTGKSAATIIAYLFTLLGALGILWTPTSPEMKMVKYLIDATGAMVAAVAAITAAARAYPSEVGKAAFYGAIGFGCALVGGLVFICQVQLLMTLYIDAAGNETAYSSEELYKTYSEGSPLPMPMPL